MNSRQLALVVFLSFTFVSVSFGAEKIVHHVYSVAATNDEWTATKITVSPGDMLITHEQGNKVKVGKFLGETTADGLSSGEGALFLKIGVGAPKKIGKGAFIRVSEGGVVKLRVYDTKYSDNAGVYTVDIVHIPASLVPPAQVIAAE